MRTYCSAVRVRSASGNEKVMSGMVGMRLQSTMPWLGPMEGSASQSEFSSFMMSVIVWLLSIANCVTYERVQFQ